MARLYKKKLYRPVPEGAKIETTKGGYTYATWKVHGRQKSAKYVETANGPRIIEESQYYVARYTDATGKSRERSTKCRDLQNAQHLLAKWQQEEEKVIAGVMTRKELDTGKKIKGLIETYLPDFERYMKRECTSQRHIRVTLIKIRRVAKESGFLRMIDLDTPTMDKWLTDQKEKGMGATTRNHYRTAMISFANWAVEEKILTFNPLAKTHVANTELDRRHERRALTQQEVVKLLQAGETRPVYGVTHILFGKRSGQLKSNVPEDERKRAIRAGKERRLIYATLIYTGLRKMELASIAIGQVRLNVKVPHILLKAEDAKGKRAATLPLHTELTKLLKGWIDFRMKEENATLKDKLFHVPRYLDEALTKDLAFAGIDKRDSLDRVVDVHALRHTHATWLAELGVPVTVIQASMRHKDIKMTLRYMHTKNESLLSGVNQLPDISKSDDEDSSSAMVCV